MYDDVTTRNESGELAVRTVSATEGSNTSSYDDVFTRTTDGKLAMRVVGSGGSGDQHNLGYFATPAALEEAYPTAEAGDWAIVGSTDTVWLWDSDNSEWVDSDQKGQVTSVNGQTGAVTVSEVPSQTGYSGRVLGTDGFVAGWVVPEKVQRSTMPQASEEEVNNIYQYVGTTDANYTNGYFYKCVSDGQDPATYSWAEVSMGGGGSSYTAGTGIDITNDVISATVPYADDTTYTSSVTLQHGTPWSGDVCLMGIGREVTVGGNNSDAGDNCLGIGINVNAGGYYGHKAIGVGIDVTAGQSGVAVGYNTRSSQGGNSVAFGHGLSAGRGGIVIGHNMTPVISTNNAFDVAFVDNRGSALFKDVKYTLLDVEGNIPSDRIMANTVIKYTTMPTATVYNENELVQYVGATDSTYTNGYFYTNIGTQTAPSSASIGPNTTVAALTDIAVDNSVLETKMIAINWTPLTTRTLNCFYWGTMWYVYYGDEYVWARDLSQFGVTYSGTPQENDTIEIEYTGATVSYVWTQTNVQPSSGGGSSSITVTLLAANWSNDSQTVNATGVTASNSVFIGAAPASITDYDTAGVKCTAQGAGTLTFTCTTTPSSDLTVNVLIM